MTIKADVQKLEVGALVDLFQVDATDIGANIAYFHNDTTAGPIFWQGQQYDPFPIKADGFAKTSDKQPTPKLTVANLDGAMSEMCRLYDDMVGAKFIRIRTMKKYLDAVNFGKKNFMIWSEEFGNIPAWNPTGITVVSNSDNGPDGSIATADRLDINGVAAGIYQVRTVVPGQEYTFSVWVKLGTLAPADYKLALYDETNSQVVAYDVIPQGNPTGAVWTRIWHTFTVPAGCNSIRIYPFRNTANIVNKTVYVFGAQLELGAFPTEYEPKDATGRNPTADPTQEFPREIWYIERKTNENNESVQFELVTAFELNGVKLPRRQIVANYCSWMSIGGYRGPYCGYTGPPVAKADDTPTSDPLLDMCSGKMSGCKLRPWPQGILNFGGFPAAGLMRT